MTAPLTILQIGAFPFPLHQGSQVYVAGMARALARRGHRVLVACWGHGHGAVPDGVTLWRGPRVPGAEVLRSGPHWSRGLHDLGLVATLRRAASSGVIDVAHAHNVEAPLIARLGLGWRVPLVYDQHTRMSEELPTYLRRPLARRLGGHAGRAIDRAVPRLCDASIALSGEGAGALRADGARRVTHLPPAIDAADLEGASPARARARWGLDGRPWVAYAGNTDAYQDLPVFFEAMARLPDAGLLLVTGDDPAPWAARADALGIAPSRRRLVRTTAFADVRDALSAAAVAVSPRARCAGFPIKLLNSLGLGLPTVAARGSARPIPGVIAVADHDPVALAAAIGALIADEPRRAALGAAAAAAIRAEWTWDARAPALEHLYRSLARRDAPL